MPFKGWCSLDAKYESIWEKTHLILIGALVIGGFCRSWWRHYGAGARTQQREQRGFEVKLNTGGEPLMKQKEDDHG